MNINKPIVSVVIPAYNEATYIGRLLTALSQQKYDNFEVIVSDAGSHDGTDKVVASFKDRLAVAIVVSPPKGPGAGRNEGAKTARGEWLLFLDADDDIEGSNFISTLVSEATMRGWQTATAKSKPKDAKWHERIGSSIYYRYIKFLARTKHPVAPGWCILTKRQLFEANGGFNSKIQFGEDYDYVSRVGKQGFGFVESTYYLVDQRRAREEGWRLAYKAIANEIYRHTHGYNLEKNPYKYEFGKHKKKEQ